MTEITETEKKPSEESKKTDQIYYNKIMQLIPELSLYKPETISHFRARAETLKCEDLKSYYAFLQSHPEEVVYMKSNLTLKGTHFFRGDDWEFFRNKCLSQLAGKEKITIWCASCSSGEEVFSLIMCLLDYVTLGQIDILATDYNDELLEKCRAGEYYLMHLEEIPERYQRHVIMGNPKFTFPQTMKDVIQIRHLNLLEDTYPTGFDVVLCRNTIKFFSTEARTMVKTKLAETLNEDGFLFLSTDGNHKGYELIDDPSSLHLQQIDGRCIYQKREFCKKIMFITPRISGGGAEKVITALASYMAEKYEVYLVSMLPPQENPYPVSSRVVQLGLYKNKTGKKTNQSGQGQKKISEQEGQVKLSKSLLMRGKRKLRKIKKKVINKLKSKYRKERDRIRKHLWKLADKAYPEYSKERKIDLRHKELGKELDKLKKKHQIDCAVSFLNPANDINTLSRVRTPTIISIRSCLDGPFAPPESKGWFGKRRIIQNCRKADRIVAVSKETGENLCKSFHAEKKKISVIYNACDLEKIQVLGQELPQDEEIIKRVNEAEFVFASNGRRVMKKGQWHLIRAFKETHRKHPGTVLMILGKKGERDTEALLTNLLHENQMEDYVFLLGFHENPFSVLSRANAFVMSSFNEGFPNALVEAMALGLPVISTDCRSGPREILAPETNCTEKVTDRIELAEYGILTPECSGNTDIFKELEENERLLFEAMCMLIENPDLRNHYAQKSMERAAQFQRNDIMRQWEHLIEDTMKK